MTATSTAASSLPPVRTSCHVPLSLMTSISEETIALWLKLGALEKLEQAVLDGYGDQLCGKTSRIPQVNKFLKQVPLFQNKIREIHQAVSQGKLRDVQHLIDRKKLAFCRDHNGASPLHKAVIFGHQDVIEYLVKRYAGSIHIRDHQGRTALHYAAFLPDRGEIYQYLLANGADERAMDVYGRQPSYYLDGQNESTLRQLRDGSTLNGLRKIKPRYYGQVSAGQPFTNSNRPMVTKSQIRELISDGNLNALEDLVLQGQGDRLLGETSSVPKIQSFLNIVPMYMERIYDVHRAVMRDQLEHIVILLENKKLSMARDQLGATPLHKAVLFGHYKIAHYISHQFPDTLNSIDMEGRTALHYAAALKDNKNMYGILIEAGSNKGIYDNKGKTADYYAQYPEHLNLEEVIKRCHKVNANYLANTASRIKGKSPVRQTPPPSNGNLSSPRSEENNGSSKDTSQSNDSGNENELMSLLQKDKLTKRLDMSSANIRRWVNAKDMDKLTKAVMEGYGDKVVRVNTNEEYEDKEQINGKITEMVERINAIHSAVSSDDLTELQNQLEERDFALAKDHMGNTPLHKSVLLRKTKIVGYLLEKFPETINAKNKSGLTALHYAAAMSRKDGLQLYKMLLQAGADPKIRDNHGRTPDYYKTHLITLPNKGMMRSRPIAGRHSETLNRYSKQGVLERMTTALNRGDVELLQDLVLEGHGKHLYGKTSWNEDVKSFLKELPSYLNTIQLFHEASRHGDVETINELVTDNEKLMRARNESGALPIHIAAASESAIVLEYFVKNYPSSLNVKDCTGKTALHILSQKGNITLTKLLKLAGADPKILDQKGKTADYYLQNANKDGPRIDNDSSKSSLNSSSDSSYSFTHRENTIRKRSKGRFKKQMVRENLKEGIEIATTNGVLEKNEDIVENTEPEQEEDPVIDEEPERKESLSETVGSKDEAEAEESEKAQTDGDAVEEVEVQDSKEEEAAEDEENEAIMKEDDITVELDNVEETAENTEAAEKPEEATEVAPENNENEDNNVSEHKNDDNTNFDDPSAENKEENDNDKNNMDETIESADATVEVEEVDTEEPGETDDAKAESEEFKDDHNEEPDEENAKDNSNTETKEEEEEEKEEEEEEEKEEEEKEEKEMDSEENERVEELDASGSSPKEDTDNMEKTDYDEEVETESGNGEKKEKETEETDPVQDTSDTAEDNVETDVKDAEEENPDESGDAENEKSETDLGDVTVSEEIENENDPNSNDPEKHDTDENADHKENERMQKCNSEEAGAETTENNPDNPEEDCKNINDLNAEEGETEINDAPEDDNVDKNDTDINDEEKNDGNDENDITEKENNTNENAAEEKAEEDKDTPDDELNNENDATVEKENPEQIQTENDEAGEEGEKNDVTQDETEVTENDTSNPNDAKTNGHDETPHQTKDHLDELIEHWIKEGDLLRLEHVVLAGQGDRLIERTSDDKQVQDFLDLVPIYMAKIRAVHEAVAKGQLREVRSVLTRKRFALSRDHVGASPLHLAVLYGHTDVSTYIISHFPETMDGPDNEGRTPLHYAAALRDNGTLYRLLKAAGADENIEDKAGHSPKYYMSYPGLLTLETLLEPYSTSE